MELGELISYYRRKAGLTLDELAEMSGVPKSTINKIIGGITKAPTLDNVKSIAKALGVRLSDLADEPQLPELFSSSEQSIIKKYRALDEHGKEIVDTNLEIEYRRCENARAAAEAEKQRQAETEARRKAANAAHAKNLTETAEEIEPEPSNIIELNFNDQKASAGSGFELDYEHTQPWKVIYNELTRKADFCVEVEGNSMEPKFYDGDIILVREQPSVDEGEIGLFTVNDLGYVKKKGPDRLISINPNVDDIYPGECDEVRCFGKVLGVLELEWIVER